MSQKNDIRDYLLIDGNSLTPLEALQRFECISLGQRIYDLKKLGWQFSEEWESHGKKKVKRFKMIGDVAVDATPVAIDTMANTDAVESEEWKDIRRICRPKYIKADSDTSEETEPIRPCADYFGLFR